MHQQQSDHIHKVLLLTDFYSSGQIPLTATGDLVEGDITVQTNQVFANLKAVLGKLELL